MKGLKMSKKIKETPNQKLLRLNPSPQQRNGGHRLVATTPNGRGQCMTPAEIRALQDRNVTLYFFN